MKVRQVYLAVAVMSSAVLSGCQEESNKPVSNTQVVAKVNQEELTVHQLNQVLAQVRAKVSVENQERVKQEALKKLVDQSLLMQAATKAGLDRTPEVLTLLEAAKRKVLIDAYLKRSLQSVTKPTEAQVEEFYNKNALIFSDRALFVYSQVTIPTTQKDQSGLIEKVKSSGDLSGLLKVLSSNGVKFTQVRDAKTSEKLPRALLKPMNTVGVGDLGFLKMSDGILVISIEQKNPMPVALAQAKDAIERQLIQVERKKMLSSLLDSLNSTAQVEYMGAFVELNN